MRTIDHFDRFGRERPAVAGEIEAHTRLFYRGEGKHSPRHSSYMDASKLILDYVAICEKTGVLLDFGEFIPLWIVANEIAEGRVRAEMNRGIA